MAHATVEHTDSRVSVAAVVGVDGHPALGHTAITIEDGVIAGLQPIVDSASTLIAMPVLVNAHDHGRGLGMTDAGIADGLLETWLSRLAGDQRNQTELVGQAARLMVSRGIGASVFCVNPGTPDIEAEVDEACAAARSVGIRAAVVVPFADTGGRMRGRDDRGEITDRLQMFTRLAARTPDLDLQLGPVGPQWITEASLAAVNEYALTHGVRIHMHLLESPGQRTWADELYPEGVVTWLDRLGVLGPHTWFAHGTQLRPDEFALLAEKGCGLALNASSNLRLCSGFAPVAAAVGAGVNAGMGLDGLGINEDADPWTELRLLRGIAQAQSHQSCSAADILAMGFNPAPLGSHRPEPIVQGSRADLLVVDIGQRAHLLRRGDWSVADVILAAPLDVRTLWVGGSAIRDTHDDLGEVSLTIGDLT